MRLCDTRCLQQEIEEYRLLLGQLQGGGSWRASALERKLRRAVDQLAEQLWEITKLIGDIPDPELRLIFELRYFRGCSWKEVAQRLPTLLSADGARMKHDRYLARLSKKAPTAEK